MSSLVAGIDSSTQACKVVIRDAETGALVRSGRAPHPVGTEIDPHAWWDALGTALRGAGGLEDVDAISVAGQQHGMVLLDEVGEIVRPALLWNDLRSASAARELIEELGGQTEGRRAWAEATGSVPVASFTVTKLRWVAEHEPESVKQTAAVCLPHDWLSWQLRGAPSGLEALTTDRGEASGTGYWSPSSGRYRIDLLERAFGAVPLVPRVLAPADSCGASTTGALVAAGTGDNAAAALGLGAQPGDVVVSIGTSGTVFAVAESPTSDATGAVTGFADATGRFLPLVCTVNAAKVLDAFMALLGVDAEGFSSLALSAPPGAEGLTLVPYLEGERTPDRPHAAGSLHGVELDNISPRNLARAAVEGVLCGLADGLDALSNMGVPIERLFLIGGAARSAAVRAIAPSVLCRPILVPLPDEYVANGAARQAAWALTNPRGEPPPWQVAGVVTVDAPSAPRIRARFAQARDHTIDRLAVLDDAAALK